MTIFPVTTWFRFEVESSRVSQQIEIKMEISQSGVRIENSLAYMIGYVNF